MKRFLGKKRFPNIVSCHGNDCQVRIAVDPVHETAFLFPIGRVALQDAKSIDPKILDIERPCDHDSILNGWGLISQVKTDQSFLQIGGCRLIRH